MATEVFTASAPAATAPEPVEPVDRPPTPQPVDPNGDPVGINRAPTLPDDATAPETPDAKAAEEAAKVEPPPPPADPKTAAKFAALAKREKEITAKAAEWKPKIEAAEKFEAARAKAKADPYAALEALGLNLQELVDAAIHHNKPETVEDRVARLEAERVQFLKDREQSSAQEIEQTIARHRSSVADFVNGDPDAYELVVARGAHGLVFEVIEEHFKATGQLMPSAQAAEMVENHLLTEARKMMSLKKLGGGVPAHPAPPAPPPGAPVANGKPAAPSLSSQSTKPNPTPPSAVPDYESHDAAIARIVAKMAAGGNART